MANSFNLNSNEYLQQCDSKDVISFNSDKWIGVGKLKEIVHRSFTKSGVDAAINYISKNSELRNNVLWFNDGEKCEILKAGSQGWQKGKIKINITLEFIPDEPESIESPLDDVRQEIEQSKS